MFFLFVIRIPLHKSAPSSVGGSRTYLIRGFLGHHESPHPERHLDVLQGSRNQQTDTQTDHAVHATCVTIDRILCCAQ